MDNRENWSGETYTNLVFSLYKIRYSAHLALHPEAQSTRDAAKAWREFADVSGKKIPKGLLPNRK